MASYPILLDPTSPEVRIDFGIAEAEFARQSINRATAAQVAAVHAVLREAREAPEVFLGPHADVANREHVEFAERAAIADLAVRLSIAENSVRAYDRQASTMINRTPTTWASFRDGEVSPANARVVAELAATLPADRDVLQRFDELVCGPATRLAPARFSARARAIRERVHTEGAAERHRRSVAERRVQWQAEVDGMMWLSAYLPAEAATRAMIAIDAQALALVSAPDATRTLDQARADVLAELLAGEGGAGPVGVRVGVRVGVLVPVMTLLGGDEPATLEGYGPIDAVTARRLTAEAPSFYRVLTDPIKGTILDIDRVTLRIPADMRRWLQHRDQVCTFPGCGRRASACDLDHTIDRQYGGTTRVSNLAHLCRNHHRAKHQTRWKIEQTADGSIQWTSPTGYRRTADPPPY